MIISNSHHRRHRHHNHDDDHHRHVIFRINTVISTTYSLRQHTPPPLLFGNQHPSATIRQPPRRQVSPRQEWSGVPTWRHLYRLRTVPELCGLWWLLYKSVGGGGVSRPATPFVMARGVFSRKKKRLFAAFWGLGAGLEGRIVEGGRCSGGFSWLYLWRWCNWWWWRWW